MGRRFDTGFIGLPSYSSAPPSDVATLNEQAQPEVNNLNAVGGGGGEGGALVNTGGGNQGGDQNIYDPSFASTVEDDALGEELLGIKSRRNKLNALRGKIDEWKKAKTGKVNLRPFMQWVDDETGSHFASGFKEPMTEDEKAYQAMDKEIDIEQMDSSLTAQESKIKNYLRRIKSAEAKTEYTGKVKTTSDKRRVEEQKKKEAARIALSEKHKRQTYVNKNAEKVSDTYYNKIAEYRKLRYPNLEKKDHYGVELEIAKQLAGGEYDSQVSPGTTLDSLIKGMQ